MSYTDCCSSVDKYSHERSSDQPERLSQPSRSGKCCPVKGPLGPNGPKGPTFVTFEPTYITGDPEQTDTIVLNEGESARITFTGTIVNMTISDGDTIEITDAGLYYFTAVTTVAPDDITAESRVEFALTRDGVADPISAVYAIDDSGSYDQDTVAVTVQGLIVATGSTTVGVLATAVTGNFLLTPAGMSIYRFR